MNFGRLILDTDEKIFNVVSNVHSRESRKRVLRVIALASLPNSFKYDLYVSQIRGNKQTMQLREQSVQGILKGYQGWLNEKLLEPQDAPPYISRSDRSKINIKGGSI